MRAVYRKWHYGVSTLGYSEFANVLQQQDDLTLHDLFQGGYSSQFAVHELESRLSVCEMPEKMVYDKMLAYIDASVRLINMWPKEVEQFYRSMLTTIICRAGYFNELAHLSPRIEEAVGTYMGIWKSMPTREIATRATVDIVSNDLAGVYFLRMTQDFNSERWYPTFDSDFRWLGTLAVRFEGSPVRVQIEKLLSGDRKTACVVD